MWHVHKFQVAQQYGGSEEGGWWFEAGWPAPMASSPLVRVAFDEEDQAYAVARALNDYEDERRKGEDYDYTSVLSDRSSFFSYQVSEEALAVPYPESRPHYE